MNIGIIAPASPQTFQHYFDSDIQLPKNAETATSVNSIILGLLELGHKVILFTTVPYKYTPSHFRGRNIDIYVISSKYPRGLSLFSRFFLGYKLRKFVAKEINNMDVLHAHWTYEFAYASIPFVEKLPVFCSVRDWCPFILSQQKTFKSRIYWICSYWLFRQVMKNHNIHFIANSEYTKERILSTYPQRNISIIPNPIIRKDIRKDRTEYPSYPVFISICQSIHENRKNIITLLKAFNLYSFTNRKAQLVLVGSYSQEIIKEWKKIGLLSNVVLTGLLSRAQLLKYLDNATALIHPSIEETFGNTLLEGMARRVPCIGGKDSGAVPKVLGYGKYGLLCDIKNVDSIILAMKETENKEKMKTLIDACTLYLESEYSNDVIAAKHIKLFQYYILK